MEIIVRKIKKLLIAYDGSGYSHAALYELKQSGLPQEAEAIVISVSETWLPVEYEDGENFPDREVFEYHQKYRDERGRRFAETKAIATAARDELLRYFPSWDLRTEVVSGSPATEILSRASEFAPDLIIVGPQGLSSDRGSGLGSTSEKILSASNCSVRISRVQRDASRSQFTVLIGFDGSDGSMAAVREVARRTWETKPEVRLLTVTDPFTLLEPSRVLQPVPGMSEGELAGERRWVESLATDALQILRDAGLSATLNNYSGNPRMILIRKAEEWGADAIFIGAHSHRRKLRSDSIGCVAMAIASRSDCSVEIVRELELN